MSFIHFINYFFVQWFFIRIYRTVDNKEWGILYWVVPGSGWGDKFKTIGGPYKCKCLIDLGPKIRYRKDQLSYTDIFIKQVKIKGKWVTVAWTSAHGLEYMGTHHKNYLDWFHSNNNHVPYYIKELTT